MSHIVKWVLVALFAWSALATVTKVGKPAKSTQSGEAAISVAVNALIILAIVLYWH